MSNITLPQTWGTYFTTFATSSGSYYASNEKTDDALHFLFISANFFGQT